MLTQDILHQLEAQCHHGSQGLVATNFGIYMLLLIAAMIFSSSSITYCNEDTPRATVVMSSWGKKIMRIVLAVTNPNGASRKEQVDRKWIVAVLVTYGELVFKSKMTTDAKITAIIASSCTCASLNAS